MSKTYARQIIEEFEQMKKVYKYKEFICNLNNIHQNKYKHLDKFITGLEIDIKKLINSEGEYKKDIDDELFGNKKDFEVTHMLLMNFKRKLSPEYQIDNVSSL